MTPQRRAVLQINQGIVWLSSHWLAVANTFFFLYTALPFLAPILLSAGLDTPARWIYSFYSYACHQLPERSYTVAGRQVAFCQRDTALYGGIFLVGLLYSQFRFRLPEIELRWYVFLLVPMALDGGMAMASEWSILSQIPLSLMWGMGLIAFGVISAVLRRHNYLTWHSYLFFSFGPLALLYIQFFGPYTTNLYRRTLTGLLFAMGTVWYVYPLLETYFSQLKQQAEAQVARLSG